VSETFLSLERLAYLRFKLIVSLNPSSVCFSSRARIRRDLDRLEDAAPSLSLEKNGASPTPPYPYGTQALDRTPSGSIDVRSEPSEVSSSLSFSPNEVPFPLLVPLILLRFLLSPPFSQTSASSHTPPEVHSSAECLPHRGRSRTRGKRNAETLDDLFDDGDDEEEEEEKITFSAA